MKELRDLTQDDLFHLANLATGGWFDSEFSSKRVEVEVGGFDKRRRVEWIQNLEGYEEHSYFEIDSETSDGWAWHCKVVETVKYHNPIWSNGWTVNTIAPHKLVDYLRENDFNIENK